MLLQKLSGVSELDDHSVHEFLKTAVEVVPADVIEMLKIRLQDGARNFGYRTLRRDRTGGGLALLSHSDGRRLLREFLGWAVNVRAGGELAMDIGICVSGLCGKYGHDVLDLLLELVKGGSQAHVDVAASVLRSAHQELVVDETPFIREVLNQAELISEQAVKDISAAVWSSTLTGGRSGVVGEPFKEDVALQAHGPCASTLLRASSACEGEH
ncbi:hypothetical protein [Cupriavidus sp. CuC1]|uniref:hypothetical protein n=1 Tax=Cupriavidus sp. CuC1 TaxID=3373131 RepID=UPI0037D767AA